jgi:heme oxygenase
LCSRTVDAFAPSSSWGVVQSRIVARMTAAETTTTASTETTTTSFIDTELRGAAMKLHTRAQAPREGQAEVAAPAEPYVTTHADYLAFLVDSQHVYQALEDVVNSQNELQVFRNTGLERVAVLEEDIAWMTATFDLESPTVGRLGQDYATLLRDEASRSTPALVCHFYNFYFAHTAGGRMIGECYRLR